MLALTNKPAKLASINLRSELHGDEHVPALDLGFSFDTSNDELDMLGKMMRSAFYYKARGEAAAAQGSLEGVEPVSDTPNRRLTSVAMPLKLEAEWTAFHCGIGSGAVSKPIELSDCTVAVRHVDMKEGGTVSWLVRVQVSKPGRIVDKLSTLLQTEVELSLEQRPGEEAQGAIGGESETDGTGGETEAASGETNGDATVTREQVERGGPTWPFPDGDPRNVTAPPAHTTEDASPGRKAAATRAEKRADARPQS